MRKSILHIIFFVVLMIPLFLKATPEIHTVTPNAEIIPKYEKLELRVTLSALFSNPYDYNQIRLKGIFISPSGQQYIMDGFYFQNYEMTSPDVLQSSGPPDWRIRFSPNQVGTWTYSLSLYDATGTSYTFTQEFVCVDSDRKGFVRKNGNRLVHSNGETFHPLGVNLAFQWWWDGFSMYEDWIDALDENGGNFTKLSMAPWIFEIEWQETGTGQYTQRQNRAWVLDWVFDQLMEKDIYCQLNVMIHDELRSDSWSGWNVNPYNNANGGPCNEPQNFFVNETAINLYKQKLRYINARWGYSPQVAMWEHISETDNTQLYSSFYDQTLSWLNLMTSYLGIIDIFDRPISTGYSIPQHDPAYWGEYNTKFTQLHLYDFVPDLEMKIYNFTKWYRDTWDKPVIVGEFGLGHDVDLINELDPNGIAFHNTLWSSMFSGSIGSAMAWYWDNYLYPNGLFDYLKPVSDFLAEVDMDISELQTNVPLCSSEVNDVLSINPDYNNQNEKAPESYFHFDPSGLLYPLELFLGEYLYGSFYGGRRNPPTFKVNYAKGGQLKIKTADVAIFSKIKVKLNGSTIFEQSVGTNSNYSMDIPAGEHEIRIENSGSGLVKIENYQFHNYAPDLRSFALKNEKYAVGWFQNRKYNWGYLNQYGAPDPISNGEIFLEDITPGVYNVNWFNGQGVFDSSQIIFTISDQLTLDAPNIVWDGAYEAEFISPVQVSFSVTPLEGYAPLEIQFTDQSTNTGATIDSWSWDFGDGTTSNWQHPPHTYLQAGIYTVTLQVVSGQYTQSYSRENYIHVLQPLLADFVADTTLVKPMQVVHFTDLSLGYPEMRMWTFGDNSLSFADNPAHFYLEPGQYTVSLFIQTDSRSDLEEKINYIEVLTPIEADFIADNVVTTLDEEVHFWDNSTGSPDSWRWDFGNGGGSNDQNPVVVYDQSGTYSVSLSVFNNYFEDSIYKTGYITILETLHANFSSDTTLILPGQQVQYTDLSQGNPEQWNWFFGDGQESNLQNPVHTYSETGLYSVTLTVGDILQTSSEIKENYITVVEPLLVDFVSDKVLSTVGGDISFTDFSTGNPSGWLWDFGNGSNSNSQNPFIQYDQAGTYSISLTVFNAYFEDSLNKSDYITILEPLVAEFSSDITVVWVDDPIQFSDYSEGNPEQWHWNFGDGVEGILQNPVHAYNRAGAYSVGLQVSDTLQSSSEFKENYIQVREPLDAEFTADTTVLVLGEEASFSDLSKGSPLLWLWLFGDKNSSQLQNPVHLYENPGEYSVSLQILKGDSLDVERKANYIKVIPPMVADFVADTLLGQPGELIQLFDLSSGNPDTWNWDFGDNSNNNLQNPMISYTQPGTYSVTLIASNSYVRDTLTKQSYITILEPLSANFWAEPLTGRIGDEIAFYDLSTGNPNRWEWWLGNGDSSFLQNPTAIYQAAGLYDITLIVGNMYLRDTLTISNYLQIIPPSYAQNIILKKGWSGISTYIKPVFPAIDQVLEPVSEEFYFAFNEQGVFSPELNINTMGDWNTEKGLTIFMHEPSELTIRGYDQVNNELALSVGWSYLPVYSSCAHSIYDFGEALGVEFKLVKEVAGWKMYWPEMGVYTLDSIKPGNMYQIYLNQATQFSFPGCD